MNEVVHSQYGGPEVLRIEEIGMPVPKHDEVRIRVRAAAVNPMDRHFMRGHSTIGRIAMGLRKPKITRLGADVAGVVDAVGAKVTKFNEGDEVFGAARDAFAESVCGRDDRARQRDAPDRSRLPAREVPQAIAYVEEGHAQGKVVIRV